MVHLEVVVHPKCQRKPIVYRNVECIAMEYNHEKNEIAVYETYTQWVDKTPGYYFICVVKFIYFDDTKVGVSTTQILDVINRRFPNFFKEWEFDLIINDCREQNAQTDDDILRIIDDYLTGIENSI